MHIPDGILAPPTIAATMLIGGSSLAYCLHRVRKDIGNRAAIRIGNIAAFLFAAQMVNFPIPVTGFTGHLIGGTLAAALQGPWIGAGAIALVLLTQCIFFGDGGITALGANFTNMGLIGALVGYTIYAPLSRRLGGRSGMVIAAMAAAWFSTILASGACAIEIAATSSPRAFTNVLSWMTLTHAAIGVGEALITGLTLRCVLLIRPDLVIGDTMAVTTEASSPQDPKSRKRERQWGWREGLAALLIAAAVAIFLAPLAAANPDGLEWVCERLGISPQSSSSLFHILMPDYQAPGFAAETAAAVAVAGLVGTIIVFATSCFLIKGLTIGAKANWSRSTPVQ